MFIQHRIEYLPNHELTNYRFTANTDLSTVFENPPDLIMIETWHQYCSRCFESMADFHPYFESQEKNFSFTHFYAFVGQNMTDSAIYHFRYLPQSGEKVIIDNDLAYYNSLAMQGAPYFNFYQKGKYLFSLSGYEKKFKSRYKKLFDQLISSHSTIRAQ